MKENSFVTGVIGKSSDGVAVSAWGYPLGYGGPAPLLTVGLIIIIW